MYSVIEKAKNLAQGRWGYVFQQLGDEVLKLAAAVPGKHHPEKLEDGFRFVAHFDNHAQWMSNSQCGQDGIAAFVYRGIYASHGMAAKAIVELFEGDRTPPPHKQQCLKPVNPDREKKWKEMREYANRLLSRADLDTKKTIVGYMSARGLPDINQLPQNWFGLPDLQCREEGKGLSIHPALIAPVFCCRRNRMVGLHRTYLQRDKDLYYKADIENPKKLLAAFDHVSGGAIMLYQDGRTDVLHLTEGIETAIAVREKIFSEKGISANVWACVSSTMMLSVNIPDYVRHVHIWADRDRNATGQDAAISLQNRLRKEGVNATIWLPKIRPIHVKSIDWLDMYVRNKSST